MKRPRLRSALLCTAFALVALAGWHWFAPTQIGGTTTYVATSGISMEPRFHTGDLAIVRPASQYRVGQVVAYRSSLLHLVVLHRIIGRDGDRYVFKGDNNDFIDPTRPLRSQLIGALWLHLTRGGAILTFFHTPAVAAVVIGAVALLMLGGAGEARRRRRRRGEATAKAPAKTRFKAAAPGPVTSSDGSGPLDLRPFVIAAAVCAGLCLVAGLLAFANPTSRSVSRPISYIQSERFGYAAPVTPGPVYPDGTVRTGQPIFLHLARTVRVWGEYRFTTRSVRQVGGAGSMSLVLTGPTGWRRTLPIAGTMRFEGPRGVMQATLDLTALEGLLAQIQRLTGISAQSGYTIAVVARTRLAGVVAGRPLRLTFAPALTFQLQSLQLQVSAASGSGGTLYQVKKGSIPSSATVANHLEVLGRAVAVGPLRWLALIGFWIAASAVAGLLVALRLRRPFAETERIRARYGHLLVPVVAAPDVLDRVPYDVADIEALARLAEAGDRLILHHRDPGGDVYLVSDDTSVFRYRPGPGRIVWGEWSPPRLSDEVTPPDHAATDGTNGASAARNGHGAAPSTGVPLAAFEVAVARPATRESLLVVLTRRLSRWSATTRRPGGRPGRGR